MDGKDERGASSPDKPALHIPDPLSITTGVPLSSAIDQSIFLYQLQNILIYSLPFLSN